MRRETALAPGAAPALRLLMDDLMSLKDAFLNGMSRAANSVYVVTTDGPAGKAGVTVSAMTSVSVDEGPRLLVCIHHLSPVADAIRRNGVFGINLLREHQFDVAERFAGRVKDGRLDKFAGIAWTTLKTGSPVLSEALASFDCDLATSFRQGSHWVFIGTAVDVVVRGDPKPLLYANRGYAALASAV